MVTTDELIAYTQNAYDQGREISRATSSIIIAALESENADLKRDLDCITKDIDIAEQHFRASFNGHVHGWDLPVIVWEGIDIALRETFGVIREGSTIDTN